VVTSLFPVLAVNSKRVSPAVFSSGKERSNRYFIQNEDKATHNYALNMKSAANHYVGTLLPGGLLPEQ
jgi:hypothetical protein